MIRSTLRRRTIMWPPVKQALELSKRASKSTNIRLKWEYKCAACKKWHPKKQVAVDHIVEAGSLTCYEDLHKFVENLFCEIDNLRVLCHPCHDAKTYKR